ncbi:MAG: carbohydrate kinase family protein [Candidatus Bipolaricaulota bacterium]
MDKVMVLGAPFLDLMAGFPLEEAEVDLSSEVELKLSPGAPASNVATGLQRLGTNTAILGRAGDDWFGNYLKKAFQEEGVDTSRLFLGEGESTGIVFPVIDGNGVQQSFELINEPAQFDLSRRDIENLSFPEDGFLFADGVLLMEHPGREALVEGVKQGREEGITVVFDPNFRLPASALKKEGGRALELILEAADFILLNDEELETLRRFFDEKSRTEAVVERLLASDTEAVIVKKGAEGHEVITGNESFNRGAFSVEVLDTQGAGDAFDAGFIAGLAKGLDYRHAALIGGGAGAIVCTGETAWGPLPELDTLRFFLERKGEKELAEALEAG